MKFLKKLIKNNSFLLALIALVISIIMVIGFFSYILSDANAKYVNNESYDSYLETNHFYFSSDVLSSEQNIKTINQYDYEEIPFFIFNSDAGRVSSNDIEYDLSCSVNNSNYSCKIDNEDTNTKSDSLGSGAKCYNGSEEVELEELACYNAGYRYLYTESINSHVLKISKNNSSDTSSMLEVTISATSSSPFIKTISTLYKLRLVGANDNKINVNLISDENGVCRYTIENNYSIDRRVKIGIDVNNLLFDLTGEFYKNKLSSSLNNGYIDSMKVSLSPNKTYSFDLYKKNFNYTCDSNDVNTLLIEDINTRCNFSGSLVQGAIFDDGVYTYKYKQQATSSGWENISTDGWGVSLTNKNATEVNVPPCSSLGGKNIVSLNYLFYNAKKLSYVDLSGFDTSNIVGMKSVFSRTGQDSTVTIFNLLGLDKWNTSNVTDMSNMFYYTGYYANDFNIDLSKFDTSKVTNMSGMFNYTGYSASNVDLGDINHFDVSKVTNMSNMFAYAFYNATEFNVDLSSWTTTKATNMSGMFSYAWSGADPFVLDISSFNTSLVTNMSNMFNGTSKVKRIYVGNNFNTSGVTTSTSMFGSNTVLVGQNGTLFNSSNSTDKTLAKVDGGTGNTGYLSSHYVDKRSKCTFAGTLTQGASFNDSVYTYKYKQKKNSSSWENISNDGWGVSLTSTSLNSVSEAPCFSIDNKPVVATSYAFASALNLGNINLTGFESSNIIYMEGMFNRTGESVTSSFTMNGIDGFDTSNVVNMSNMFNSTAKNSNNARIGDLSLWNTKSVINMSSMFENSGYNSSIYYIGYISKWNTKNVSNMSNMFKNAGYNSNSFNIGELNDWDLTNLTNIGGMFYNTGYSASKFNIGDLNEWNSSHISNKSNAFLNTGHNYGYVVPNWY